MRSQRQVPEHMQRMILSVMSECRKVIVGKDDLIENLLIAVICEGHALLEGVPGVAKTTIGKTFSSVLGLDFKRIQGTPDMLPADITGTHVLDPKTGSFRLEKGPVFCNILLIDEINRNTPKTSSAILEAMQERQVTIEGETHKVPYPFMVIATQSPIEFHGVFPLPEVLIDRFLFSMNVGYPSSREEIEITDRIHEIEAAGIKRVLESEQLSNLTSLAKNVFVAPQVSSYVVDMVQRTRNNEAILLGAGPRASIALLKASRARAIIKGRMYVLPDDVKHLAPLVLRHRLVLRTIAQNESANSDTIVGDLIEETPIPPRPP